MTPRFFTLLSFLLVAPFSHAGPQFGTKLGEVNFEDWQNGLVLKLADCKDSSNTPIQEVKFTVQQRRIHVDRMKLVLHTGEQLDIKVDKDIRAGLDQDWLKIGEKPGCISLIRIVEDEDAKRIPEPQKVILEIWGR